MKVLLKPKTLGGFVDIPPSKSESHRAIICASLAKGTSHISNIIYSDDVLATINSMEHLGVTFEKHKDSLTIHAPGQVKLTDDSYIDAYESGSTLRFLIPIFSLTKEKVIFTGKRSLLKRPLSIYETLFKEKGLSYQKKEETIMIEGVLPSGIYSVPGNVSSQFISGLLFALPLVKGDSKIILTSPLESKQYVDMTIHTLNHFGVVITQTDDGYFIKGNQHYEKANIIVEGDYSQAAVFAVIAMISDNITCMNLSLESLQPDKAILSFLTQMNGVWKENKNNIAFVKSKTDGIVLDVSQSPDIAPILALLGSLSEGETKIVNAKRLVIKESNRLLSTYETLKKLGVNIELSEDSLTILGTTILKGGVFDSYNDHRIVMMISAASTRCDSPVLIENAEAINKSYPTFFDDLRNLGADVTYIEE